MSYTTKDIRNVCLLGHGGSGKTTLTENMLYLTGAIDRQGKVNDGNTVCDYDAEEIKRQVTISAAIAPISFGGKKINVIDCPGFQDFAGEVAAALRAVEAGITSAPRRTAFPSARSATGSCSRPPASRSPSTSPSSMRSTVITSACSKRCRPSTAASSAP